MEKYAQQYFTHYAEAEVQLLDAFPAVSLDEVVCIPAFNENSLFLESLNESATALKIHALAIVVINQPEGTEPTEQNLALLQQLDQCSSLWKNQHLHLRQYSDQLSILLVDRFNTGQQIPAKKGVGLARKIACDLASYLQQTGVIRSRQIFSSDADVTFPVNYFSVKLDHKHSAYVFDFMHSPSGDHSVDQATQVYDKSLHHYVEGLKLAGSSYAFQTIGSCLLLDTTSYLQARGFPKRAGGEDFYLLNKLNKLKPVHSKTGITLAIESRLSDRVPFGTGPAVQKLLDHQTALFYQPECFVILKQWLSLLDKISNTDAIVFLDIYSSVEMTESESSGLTYHQALLEELAQVFELEETCAKLWKNFKTAEQRKQQLHFWFDGFKTLKLIHYLTEQYYPKQHSPVSHCDQSGGIS